MLKLNELNELNKKTNILKYEDLKDINDNGFRACIGQDKNEQNIFIDFEKTSHVLVGGSSGSGKSCLMNCIVTSLLNKYENFYLSIVDIKRVEFLQYKNSERLAVPIVESSADAAELLQKYVDIMYNRYNLLNKHNAKNIKEYNEKSNDAMTRHVIIIDELADVLLDNKVVKIYLQKLLQLGRAVGIHLILATQAPNCKTIPTELKINITCRIALQVPNYTNSKIIIDEKGAEMLKGNGDALIRINNMTRRFQVALV